MLLRKNEPRIFDSAEMRGFSYMCENTFIIYEFRRINQKRKEQKPLPWTVSKELLSGSGFYENYQNILPSAVSVGNDQRGISPNQLF